MNKVDGFQAIKASALLAAIAATPLAQAKGPAPAEQAVPYELSVVALQGKDQGTDVYLTVGATTSGIAAPQTSKHVQLKSFDLNDKLRWVQNANDVALVPDGPGASMAEMHFGDMVRYQPIQAQVQVPEPLRGNTVVVRGAGAVLLRPDLAVDSVNAPAEVTAGQVVNIVVTLRELNGDLGATATAYLKRGDEVLDRASDVHIDAMGNAVVVFSLPVTDPGSQDLTISVEASNPGDYDLANNQASFHLDVISNSNVVGVPYKLSYQYRETDYTNEWSDPFGAGVDVQNGVWEDISQQITLDRKLEFPIDQARFEITADNRPAGSYEAKNVPASFNYNSGCRWYKSGGALLQDGIQIYISSSGDSCTGQSGSTATASRYAADYVYYSEFHDYFWGDVQVSQGQVLTGQTLKVNQRLGTRFVIEDDGAGFGGHAAVTVTAQPLARSWNNDWGWGYVRGHEHGVEVTGSSTGLTTP